MAVVCDIHRLAASVVGGRVDNPVVGLTVVEEIPTVGACFLKVADIGHRSRRCGEGGGCDVTVADIVITYRIYINMIGVGGIKTRQVVNCVCHRDGCRVAVVVAGSEVHGVVLDHPAGVGAAGVGPHNGNAVESSIDGMEVLNTRAGRDKLEGHVVEHQIGVCRRGVAGMHDGTEGDMVASACIACQRHAEFLVGDSRRMHRIYSREGGSIRRVGHHADDKVAVVAGAVLTSPEADLQGGKAQRGGIHGGHNGIAIATGGSVEVEAVGVVMAVGSTGIDVGTVGRAAQFVPAAGEDGGAGAVGIEVLGEGYRINHTAGSAESVDKRPVGSVVGANTAHIDIIGCVCHKTCKCNTVVRNIGHSRAVAQRKTIGAVLHLILAGACGSPRYGGIRLGNIAGLDTDDTRTSRGVLKCHVVKHHIDSRRAARMLDSTEGDIGASARIARQRHFETLIGGSCRMHRTYSRESGSIRRVGHHAYFKVAVVAGAVLTSPETNLQGIKIQYGGIHARHNGVAIACCGSVEVEAVGVIMAVSSAGIDVGTVGRAAQFIPATGEDGGAGTVGIEVLGEGHRVNHTAGSGIRYRS